MPEIKKLYAPHIYEEAVEITKYLLKEGSALVSLSRFKSTSEAKKLKDFILGFTYAKGGSAFQYRKLILYYIHTKFDSDLLFSDLSTFAWREE